MIICNVLNDVSKCYYVAEMDEIKYEYQYQYQYPVKLDYFFSQFQSLYAIFKHLSNMRCVDELLIPFNTLAESEKIMKFCSESIFLKISSVSPITWGERNLHLVTAS
jgi:hypothetical protein